MSGTRPPEPIRLALPKGRYIDISRRLLATCGSGLDAGHLVAQCTDPESTVILLKARDIPVMVEQGHVDLAIACEEWLLEAEAVGVRLFRYAAIPGWLPTRLSFFGAPGSPWPPPARTSVVTCYPALTAALLKTLGLDGDVIAVSGSTEALVGVAAAYGLDCVETGATLARHGLVEHHVTIPMLGMSMVSRCAAGQAVRRAAAALSRRLLALPFKAS